MFERFTESARDVVVRARQGAKELQHPQIGSEHLLLALVGADPGTAGAGGTAASGTAALVLRGAGLDEQRVRAAIERPAGPTAGPGAQLGAEDAAALRTIGIDLDAVLARIEESFGPEALRAQAPEPKRGLLRRGRRGRPSVLRFTPRAKKILGLALREAIRLGDNAIGSEHLLLGLLRDGSGRGAAVLTGAGLSVDDLYAATLAARARAA